MDTSSHVGEDFTSSDELGVVVRDFTAGIVILGFCDGISWVSSGAAMLSPSEFWK